MSDVDWKAKFPNMRRISGAPILFSVNGCGFCIYGRRDYDAETKTYVKTHFVTFVFVPVLPLNSYRVADAGNERWYFIGKEPLSKLCKAYNMLLLVLALGICASSAWQSYTSSPEYLAGAKMSKAQSELDKGEVVAAAHLFSEISNSGTSHSAKASQSFTQIVDGDLSKLTTPKLVALLQLAAGVSRDPKRTLALCGRALDEAKTRSTTDAAGAMKLLLMVKNLAPNTPGLKELQLSMLETAVKQKPDDMALVSELALAYEAAQDFSKCRALLEPFAAKLGSSEGARILGEMYARDEKYDQAFPLLSPYVASRLDKLRKAEAAYKTGFQIEQAAEMDRLRSGIGDYNFFRQYKASNEAAQQKLLDEHFIAYLRNNPRLIGLQESYKKEAEVVPVVLDLGIVRLRRAQSMGGDARNKELQEAEKLFLAISDAAGGSDEYKLFFAQVSFWLGKTEQGRKLTDDLLAAQKDNKVIFSISTMLREVGENAFAGDLMAKVFNNPASTQEEKNSAAHFRAVISDDIDERIKWLELCRKDPHAEASLSEERGHKCRRLGQYAEAAENYRKTLAFYEKQVPTPTSLNNGALCAIALFNVTSDPEDHNRGMKMMLQAAELAPENAILLENCASALILDIQLSLTSELNRKAIMAGDSNLFHALYDDKAGRDAVLEKYRAHPNWTRCRNLLERFLLLSPKNPNGFSMQEHSMVLFRDAAGIRSLSERLKGATLDMSRIDEAIKKASQGANSAETLKGLEVRKAQLEKILKEAKVDPKSSAALRCLLSETICSMAAYSDDADLDTAVKLVGEALEMDRKILARDALSHALSERLVKTLARQDADFSRARQQTRNSFRSPLLLAWGMLQPALRERIIREADFTALLKCKQDRGAQLPDDRAVWEHIMFSGVDPAEAQRVADAFKEPSVEREDIRFDYALMPNASISVFEAFLLAKMDDKEAEARKILDDAEKRGVRLPGSAGVVEVNDTGKNQPKQNGAKQ